ncbi:hypothetical protein Tco_0713124 [Tanacetum coccineum]
MRRIRFALYTGESAVYAYIRGTYATNVPKALIPSTQSSSSCDLKQWSRAVFRKDIPQETPIPEATAAPEVGLDSAFYVSETNTRLHSGLLLGDHRSYDLERGDSGWFHLDSRLPLTRILERSPSESHYRMELHMLDNPDPSDYDQTMKRQSASLREARDTTHDTSTQRGVYTEVLRDRISNYCDQYNTSEWKFHSLALNQENQGNFLKSNSLHKAISYMNVHILVCRHVSAN